MTFTYEPTFQMGDDDTTYRCISKDHVKEIEVGGRKMLEVGREALRLLAREAFSDVSFLLRPKHLQQLRDELDDPEASDNDRFVIYTHLQNAVVSAELANRPADSFAPMLAPLAELDAGLPNKKREIVLKLLSRSSLQKTKALLEEIASNKRDPLSDIAQEGTQRPFRSVI